MVYVGQFTTSDTPDIGRARSLRGHWKTEGDVVLRGFEKSHHLESEFKILSRFHKSSDSGIFLSDPGSSISGQTHGPGLAFM